MTHQTSLNKLYWHRVASAGKKGKVRLVVVAAFRLDGFPHPPEHPEHVSVEAVLPVPVAAFAP